MFTKSNDELNFVQISVLAICSLLTVVSKLKNALFVLIVCLTSLFLAWLICLIFNKTTEKHTKVIIYAIVSSLVVVLFNFLLKDFSIYLNESKSVFVVVATIILSIYLVYVKPKQNAKEHSLNFLKISVTFSLFLIFYSALKEFLSYGTIFEIKPFVFNGYDFCKTITYDLLFLGLVCALFDKIYIILSDFYYQRKLLFEKYKTTIKNEKEFLYDNYRRKKILTSEVIINKNDGNDEQKGNDEIKKSVILHKPKSNKRLKVSKETKVEQLFDRKKKNLGGK